MPPSELAPQVVAAELESARQLRVCEGKLRKMKPASRTGFVFGGCSLPALSASGDISDVQSVG